MKNLESIDFTESGSFRKHAETPHLVTVLSTIYLDAGLPLEIAVRSAIADYECHFDLSPSCTP